MSRLGELLHLIDLDLVGDHGAQQALDGRQLESVLLAFEDEEDLFAGTPAHPGSSGQRRDLLR